MIPFFCQVSVEYKTVITFQSTQSTPLITHKQLDCQRLAGTGGLHRCKRDDTEAYTGSSNCTLIQHEPFFLCKTPLTVPLPSAILVANCSCSCSCSCVSQFMPREASHPFSLPVLANCPENLLLIIQGSIFPVTLIVIEPAAAWGQPSHIYGVASYHRDIGRGVS